MPTICAMCSRLSGWKTMTSSSRLRNSGLKTFPISSFTFADIVSNEEAASWVWKPRLLFCVMSRAPTFDVMMTTVFLKSMTRP